MTLEENLREYRKKENLSQEQLAERLNVSRQAIAKWERGAGLPDVENLIGLSRLTGASLDELLGLTAARPAKTPDDSAAPGQSERSSDAPASEGDAAPERPFVRFRRTRLFVRVAVLDCRGADQSCGGVGGPDARIPACAEFRHGDRVAARGIPVRQVLQPVPEIRSGRAARRKPFLTSLPAKPTNEPKGRPIGRPFGFGGEKARFF